MTNDKSTMKQRLSVIFLCVSTPLALLTALLAFAQPTVADPPAAVILTATINNKIDTALRLEIETAQPGQSFNIIIHMAETADLTTIPANTSTSTRRANLVAQLQQTAAATQAPVIHQLSNLQTNGQIAHYRPFWIINAIAAQGTAEAISALAARSEVAQIRLDEVIQSFAPPDPDERTAPLRGTAVSAGTAILTGPIRSWGIERIRAPHVWNGLGIDGTGVTVGIMDTGVDYLHPDLIENYRGNLGGGTFDHAANWFHAAITTANVPTDTFGHGTHVAGTAVGRNGIGVAPGAQWIAVSIADEYGFIYESSVHAGFEWLLAPDGDPNLAPDVVNNSWSAFGFVTRFITDVTTLHMAGIIPVFAAGNDGPITGTIGSPASYTDTLGIGASDDIDSVAWFSSRGPSPLTAAQKPWIVAPGTHILSSLPGGQYGYFNGTSMATPHVVGTIALLSAAKPDLTRQEIAQILAETAVPISLTQPNNDSGWGRLDAYAAVSQVASTGLLSGTIFGDGDPLPNAALILTTTTGANLVFHTDNEGKYKAALQPGNYTASGQLFGYTAATSGIVIQAALTTTHDIYLASLPEGVIEGVVQDATTNAALTGVTIAVTNTPITVQTDANGRYTLTLPEGQYKLVAMRSGYRVGRATVLPAAGEIIAQDFHLDSAPAILLVDSGQWYFQTQAAYYETALTTLNYGYDKWSIRNPYSDVPTSEDVASYDTVIWSAPSRSPGFIGAEMVVTDYLSKGGNLLISGQNVGYYDGQFDILLWWYRDLAARFLGKTAVTHTITGADDTLFNGLTLSLNGYQSAQNQSQPDVSEPRPGALSEAAFYYDNGTIAALQAGDCEPYRIVYLGFGLEGVTGATNRLAVIDRSLAYFESPRTVFGSQFTPDAINDLAPPGHQFVYTVTIRNMSETLTDTFELKLASASWTASLDKPALTVGPCQTGQAVVTIDVPADSPKDFSHTTQLTAVSGNNHSVINTLILEHKTPGRFLFVDDDRFYDSEFYLQNALDGMGLNYDVWDVGWDDNVTGKPPGYLLNEYDFIIWYTGYDWFAPVTAVENQALTEFLAQGGRLFLTSQDFAYYNLDTELARRYLGIRDYAESIEPTTVYGGNHVAVGETLAGPLALNFGKYQNHGDGFVPAGDSRPFFWHDQGMPAGIATAGEMWRAVVWGIPFEALPPEAQGMAMDTIIGWLGDLGDSTFELDRRTGLAGEPRSYTITLRNGDFGYSNQVTLTNNLPQALTIVPGSITGGADYDATTRLLNWSGMLPSGGAHEISYQAIPSNTLSDGTPIENHLQIHYQRHNLTFNRATIMWIEAPDLTSSTLTAVPNLPIAADTITYTVTLHNSGLKATNNVSTVVRLPDELALISDTLTANEGTANLAPHRIFWQGDLNPGQTVTVSLVLTRSVMAIDRWLPSTAVIQDGVTNTILQPHFLYLPAYKQYLPTTIQK